MKAILLTAPEGGTGKTMLAGSLALALRCVKREVVAIDLDPRNRLRLHYPVDLGDPRGIAGLLAGSDWSSSIFRTREGVDLLPFGRTAGEARQALESALAAAPEQFVAELLKRIPDLDRVLVIDTPSAPAALLETLEERGCLELVVVRAAPGCCAALIEGNAQKATGKHLVVNGFDANQTLQRQMRTVLSRLWGDRLIGTIPNDPSVPEALAAQSTVLAYRRQSPAAQAILELGLAIDALLRQEAR